ncbi:toll-like receptor 3 [Monomorium pharaonis]|uniref:toll-like receptor 3 n=1 Tax=Monomorium pharaonis TaxID=307658 RepID=UPI001746F052|nr:toll-like receptor 3 [Monomorium pharaonis]
MRLAIVEFVFTILIYWTTLSIGDIHLTMKNYVDKSIQFQCKDDISLNFSNTVISYINQDFISNPIITCLNLIGSNIEDIEKGAFNKLPNLTHLFLSNNNLDGNKLFNFGTHNKLQVLIMNKVIKPETYSRCTCIQPFCEMYDMHESNITVTVQVVDEYPNLEILSLHANCLENLQSFPLMEETTSYYSLKPLHYRNFELKNNKITSKVTQVVFPKLKILDLSENRINRTNFINLLSNSLYFLDLHDNLVNSLSLNKKGNNLFALNLDNNNFKYISYQNNKKNPSLSMAGLKNLHYLSVFNNRINVIASDAFQDNDKLFYLNLSSNNINYIYPDTFANLQYLKTLDLSINKLNNVIRISKEIEINTLYINYNNITKLFSYSFVQMPKLTKLLLGQNKIDEIDVNAFDLLFNLEELDLSANMLRFLPQNWTDSLVSIKYLDLSDNQFMSLKDLSLSNTSPLIEIYFIRNSLKYLNVAYFIENLPQNLTINLTNRSNFTKWIWPTWGNNYYKNILNQENYDEYLDES